MRGSSLRLRLVLAGAVAISIAIAAALLGLTTLFTAHVERQATDALTVQLDQVIAGLDLGETGEVALTTIPTDPRFTRPYGGLYWQVSEGETVLRSRSLWDATIPLPVDELADGAEHIHTLDGPEGQTLLVAERSVTLPARLGGARTRVAVAMDRAALAEARNAFLFDLIPYAILLILVLNLAGWVQIAVGLRPLREIGSRVAAVRSGTAERLGEDFPTEVRPLATEVDALLTAREADVVRARMRAGDLAHGLKTPLQALFGEAQRLRETGRTEAAEHIEEIVGNMRRHVDRELTRARIAHQGRDAHADVALVVAGLLRVITRTHEGGLRQWDVAIPDGLNVAADPADLSEALGTLIENAARHAKRRVLISAEAQDATQPGQIEIRIADDGPGIPEDQIAALMQRGAREDTRGTGLGLTIATDIAEALGGTLVLGATSDGGLEARLTLPAAHRTS
ncbi:sensor histidine kinase [Celeribacter neptunius]|uniref:histidine kinase n=1 Tax=Celeribacter neptunius TaxID=588602 RepID=A0A1I3R1D9_9RHOB|nr:HAMP domain-containing sensor histidine kinase [Celeribacter neptunius]SFJ39592.1 Signal transduction histidine kinase [Celeribacter neptunius]